MNQFETIEHINAYELEQSFPASVHALLNMASQLKSNSDLLFKAVQLSSQINSALARGDFEDDKDSYLKRSLELLSSINEESKSEEESHTYREKAFKLRKHFLSKMEQRKVVLRATDVSKKFKHFELEKISFRLRAGEIMGIVGKNASGKSTLLRIIAGVMEPRTGRLDYPGLPDGVNRHHWSKIKRNMAYIPQKLTNWGRVDTLRNHLHFTASIKGITGQENTRVVEYFIQRLGLNDYQHLHWNEISGGMQLRFEIARALLWRPKLVVLDEPLASLDVKAQNSLLTDLRNVTNSITHPTAMIMTSHNIFDLEKVTDKIIFLRNGKPVYNGHTDNIGLEGEFNCYLLDSPLELYQVKSKLVDGRIHHIENDGQCLILYAKKSISREQVLNILTEKEIPIKYFRDITDSTWRLF